MQPSTSEKLKALRRGDLAGARELRLPGLSEFPDEIFALANTLEVLDVGGGGLTALPDDIGRLHRLTALFCSGARFERLPPALGDCASLSQIGFRGCGLREIPGESLPPHLRWLTVTDNDIASLPVELGRRPKLQKLMLSGNRLRKLPESLGDAAALELLRLSSNRFETLPGWIAELPSLAWLACAGNPSQAGLLAAKAPGAAWRHLELAELLGEGASGQVFRAHWAVDGGGEGRDVALKLFKGAMTSDGLPESEMTACLAAGAHPNLTSALGRLTDHPEGRQALLMPLLPSHWRVLAGPPSLASCSRDIYDPELRLAPAIALRIASDVARGAAHLHTNGIMHGDLYAHNVLWDGATGASVLSDFGGACALPSGKTGAAWMRLETRAWGLLLGEVLDLCPADSTELAPWRELERACVQPNVSARPLMREVAAMLA